MAAETNGAKIKMLVFKRLHYLAILAGLLFFIGPSQAWACATCGLNKSFTPATLLISFGFFLLPLLLVGGIGWKLYKDSKSSDQNNDGSPT